MLLRRLGQPFRIVRSMHRETIRKADAPHANAMRNAFGKARKARLPRGARGAVIGADTFLYFQGQVIGKPKDMAHAWRLLRRLRGKPHWVYTGLCVLDAATGRRRLSYDRSRVTFKRASDAAIRRLFARVTPLDKAGAYAVQEDRGALIARIQGSRTNVIGLPLELLRRELALFLREKNC